MISLKHCTQFWFFFYDFYIIKMEYILITCRNIVSLYVISNAILSLWVINYNDKASVTGQRDIWTSISIEYCTWDMNYPCYLLPTSHSGIQYCWFSSILIIILFQYTYHQKSIHFFNMIIRLAFRLSEVDVSSKCVKDKRHSALWWIT